MLFVMQFLEVPLWMQSSRQYHLWNSCCPCCSTVFQQYVLLEPKHPSFSIQETPDAVKCCHLPPCSKEASVSTHSFPLGFIFSVASTPYGIPYQETVKASGRKMMVGDQILLWSQWTGETMGKASCAEKPFLEGCWRLRDKLPQDTKNDHDKSHHLLIPPRCIF